MNQEQDANSKPLGFVGKTVLMIIIDTMASVVIFGVFIPLGFFSYRIATAVVGVTIFPVLVCVKSFSLKQKSIWFYLLSRVVIFIIITVLLYYYSEIYESKGSIITFKLLKFDQDFPIFFGNFLLYSIPALIAGIVYARMIKKRAGREEGNDKTTAC